MSLVVFLAVFLSQGSALRLSRRFEWVTRLLGTVGATATASIALLLISTDRPESFGLFALLVLLLGSILSLCGFALWRERTGYALRLSGWILLVAALAIPSTLTLLLPLAALLAITVHSAPEDHTPAARTAP